MLADVLGQLSRIDERAAVKTGFGDSLHSRKPSKVRLLARPRGHRSIRVISSNLLDQPRQPRAEDPLERQKPFNRPPPDFFEPGSVVLDTAIPVNGDTGGAPIEGKLCAEMLTRWRL